MTTSHDGVNLVLASFGASHHGGHMLLAMFLGIVLFVIIVGVGWVLPITLGIRAARRKNYSPLWMLAGVHPIGGWIAFIVFTFITPRAQCPNCGGFVQTHFKLCPYCHANLGPSSGAPPTATP